MKRLSPGWIYTGIWKFRLEQPKYYIGVSVGFFYQRPQIEPCAIVEAEGNNIGAITREHRAHFDLQRRNPGAGRMPEGMCDNIGQIDIDF